MHHHYPGLLKERYQESEVLPAPVQMDQNECFSVQRIDIIRLLLNHLLSYLKGLGIVRPLNLGIKNSDIIGAG